MAVDVKQYVDQLAQTAGLSDEEKAGILKALGNEKFAKGLQEGVELRSDYSRNMDAIKAERDKQAKFYQDMLVWQKAEEDRLAAAYNQLNPTVNPQPQPNTFDPEAFKKSLLDEFNKSAAQKEANYISLLKDAVSLGTRHLYEFKEPLDTEVLAKTAVDKGMSLRQAYDEMVAPRRTELQQADFKAKLAAAKLEGAQEFANTHKIPLDTSPREYHPILDKPSGAVTDYVPNSGRLTPQSERVLRDNFASEWEKEGARQSALERVGTSGT